MNLDKPLKQILASFGITVSKIEIENTKDLKEINAFMGKHGLQYVLAAT